MQRQRRPGLLKRAGHSDSVPRPVHFFCKYDLTASFVQLGAATSGVVNWAGDCAGSTSGFGLSALVRSVLSTAVAVAAGTSTGALPCLPVLGAGLPLGPASTLLSSRFTFGHCGLGLFQLAVLGVEFVQASCSCDTSRAAHIALLVVNAAARYPRSDTDALTTAWWFARRTGRDTFGAIDILPHRRVNSRLSCAA